MPNHRNIKVSEAFIKRLKEQFDLDHPKKKWSYTKFSTFIRKYILNDLPKEGNLYALVYEKAEGQWPSPITIKRAFFGEHKASKDLINVCGTYIFKEKWEQEKIRFQIKEEEQIVLDIVSIFQNYYINDSQFNIIEIVGDKDKELGVLKMDDFYAHLSYIEYKELSNRNTLIKKEQENNTRQFNQFDFDRLHLGTDYLSADIIAQNEQIAIIGNPGVGKSTYARNICYKWANKQLIISQTPIYIQLRNLNFQQLDNNILVYYIWFNYLKDISIEEVEQLFLHQHQKYLFVLDGYDELNNEKQRDLEKAIKRVTGVSNKARYIILSRPYGLIHHRFDKDIVLQIDGFTESSIENYINAFIKKDTKSGKSKEVLLTIIDSNYILKEYAHVPLMLSFIVLIYIREEAPRKHLLGIKSLYDLQAYIFRWLTNYTKGHKQNIEVNEDWKKQAGRLAYEMLMAKEFSYREDLLDYGLTLEKALEFSKLGLGSIINDNKLSWSFSFNTVTLQEFLASHYILSKITTEAFSYLLKDQYYWNFSKMLLGGLSNRKNGYHRIQAIFELLENTYNEQPTSFVRYIYYSLLSETNPDFLNRHINNAQINQLITFYQVSFFDATWHPIIQEATRRIYHKLALKNQRYLHETLNQDLSKIKDRVHVFSNEGISVIYSLVDIVNFTAVIDYPPFVKTVVQSIQILSEGIQNNPYTETSLDTAEYIEHPNLIPEAINIEMDLLNVIFILFQILIKVSKENLIPHKAQIHQFKEDCSLDLWLDIECILMKFQSQETILKELEQRIAQLHSLPIIENKYYTFTEMYDDFLEEEQEDDDELLDEVLEESNLTSQHFDIELVYLASSIYKVGALKVEIDAEIINKIINATELYINQIINPKFRLEEVVPVTQMLVKGLTLLDKPQVYDLIFDCVYRLDNDSILQIPNETKFNEYVLQKFSLLKTKFDMNEFIRLSKALETTWNGRYSFLSHRENLSDLLFQTLSKNQYFLSKYKLDIDQEEEKGEDIEILNDDNFCLSTLRQIIEIPFYAYDRKYFIDKIIDYEHQYDYLKYAMIPFLFETNFPFYQDKYWNYLFELDKNKNLGFELLEFILDDGLYYYSANLFKFKKLLLKWSEKATQYDNEPLIRKDFEVYAHLYLAVISNTLKLMEESGEQYKDNDIIKYAGDVLSIPYVQDIIQENQFLEIYDAPDLVPYIMQYYYTNDEKYVVQFDYVELRSKYIRKTSELIIGLIQLFVTTENGVISMHNINKLQPVLGADLYQDILSYIKDYNVLYESIKPFEFEKKLNQAF